MSAIDVTLRLSRDRSSFRLSQILYAGVSYKVKLEGMPDENLRYSLYLLSPDNSTCVALSGLSENGYLTIELNTAEMRESFRREPHETRVFHGFLAQSSGESVGKDPSVIVEDDVVVEWNPLWEGTGQPIPYSFVGPKGDKGDKGDKGEKGDTGLSAYELYVLHGGTLGEEDWLESLKPDAHHLVDTLNPHKTTLAQVSNEILGVNSDTSILQKEHTTLNLAEVIVNEGLVSFGSRLYSTSFPDNSLFGNAHTETGETSSVYYLPSIRTFPNGDSYPPANVLATEAFVSDNIHQLWGEYFPESIKGIDERVAALEGKVDGISLYSLSGQNLSVAKYPYEDWFAVKGEEVVSFDKLWGKEWGAIEWTVYDTLPEGYSLLDFESTKPHNFQNPGAKVKAYIRSDSADIAGLLYVHNEIYFDRQETDEATESNRKNIEANRFVAVKSDPKQGSETGERTYHPFYVPGGISSHDPFRYGIDPDKPYNDRVYFLPDVDTDAHQLELPSDRILATEQFVKYAFDSHANRTDNPHGVTAEQIGAMTEGQVVAAVANKQPKYQLRTIEIDETNTAALLDYSINTVDSTGKYACVFTFPNPGTDVASDFVIRYVCGCAPTFPASVTIKTDASLEAFSEWSFVEGSTYLITFTQIGSAVYYASIRELQ